MGIDTEAVYLFDALRYYKDTGEMHTVSTPAGSSRFPDIAPMVQPYMDGSDSLANEKASVLGFEHVGTNTFVAFKAFMTNFSETLTADWNSEIIFGRNDPVHGYKSTQRLISVGWKMPAASLSEGIENLAKVQSFLRMLYPGYDATYYDGKLPVRHLVQAPYVRMQFMNMVSRFAQEDPGISIKKATKTTRPMISYAKQTVGRGGISGGTPTGQLGAITNVSINHNLDTDVGVFQGQGAIIPKLIEIDISFAPIHEIPLGWNESKIAVSKKYSDPGSAWSNTFSTWPYGVNDGGTRANAAIGHASQADIDSAILIAREDRDKEADRLNAQARYSGLFNRMLGRYDATACAGGACEGHRASAARGAADHFNQRGHEEWASRRAESGGGYDPAHEDYYTWISGRNPQADFKTARDIKEYSKRKK